MENSKIRFWFIWSQLNSSFKITAMTVNLLLNNTVACNSVISPITAAGLLFFLNDVDRSECYL